MLFQNVLITGGAGFVGSNLALRLKAKYPETKVLCLDNLIRSGSELNVPRLEAAGIRFIKGDVRFRDQLEFEEAIDLIIECSAEPSVLAGLNESPLYLTDTNLGGTINCLELARKKSAAFLFLSTSRVYPVPELRNLQYEELGTRFALLPDQPFPGASETGIREDFPVGKIRTLYGATKLASELMIHEFADLYGIPAIINRCGVITGPWQFGKIDQGVIVLWMARHVYGDKPLSYIGFGGKGKQVRDFVHVDDLFAAIDLQLAGFESFKGETFNIGGGVEGSVSLLELTALCQEISGKTIRIDSVPEDRPGDIPIFITDAATWKAASGWRPNKTPRQTLEEIHEWILGNEDRLRPILNR